VIATLADNGVEACFANPGTSEMQFVSALDREPRVRPILCLFEGVVTARRTVMAAWRQAGGDPAAPGPATATASPTCTTPPRRTPIVNVIGDHATYHQINDAPLASDIKAWPDPIPCGEVRERRRQRR